MVRRRQRQSVGLTFQVVHTVHGGNAMMKYARCILYASRAKTVVALSTMTNAISLNRSLLEDFQIIVKTDFIHSSYN